jgi:hypothetical protein
VDAALGVKKAGFDIVELHSGTGYPYNVPYGKWRTSGKPLFSM